MPLLAMNALNICILSVLPLRKDFAVNQLFGIAVLCHGNDDPVAYAEILVVLLGGIATKKQLI